MWLAPQKLYSLLLVQHLFTSVHANPGDGLGRWRRRASGRYRAPRYNSTTKRSGKRSEALYPPTATTGSTGDDVYWFDDSYDGDDVPLPRKDGGKAIRNGTVCQGHRRKIRPSQRALKGRAEGGPGAQDVFIVALADGYDMTAHLRWLSGMSLLLCNSFSILLSSLPCRSHRRQRRLANPSVPPIRPKTLWRPR